MNPSYYQLKRLARKKSQPLFAYRLRINDFVNDGQVHPALIKTFNLATLEEWDDVSHIVVNEDGLKLPITKAESNESAIAFKFVMNPAKVDNLDDIYDALEVNKGNNVKYVIICNGEQVSEMNLQQKLFRKFFYENSSFMDSEVKFIEVTN